MNKTSASVFSSAFAIRRPNMAPRLIGAAVLALALLTSYAVRGQGGINRVKWNQPPVTGGGPTNVFYGWNQTSTENIPGAQNFQAADDWVCTTTNPVTKVRWWGSFANWQATNLPPSFPGMPNGALNGFWIIFFKDTPAGVDLPFSHPMMYKTNMPPPLARFYTNYTWRYVGQDYDPRTGTYESCFLFEQELIGDNNYIWWFYQTNSPAGTNIFWLSIIANQWSYNPPSPPMDHFWGWKTRPRNLNSPAPDDAVTYNIDAYTPDSFIPYSFQPIWWPDPTNSWDLAFELDTAKWEQPPDLSSQGMDVNATTNTPGPVFLLADDFQCTSPGLITNITIWGSWQNDNVPFDPTNVVFTLSFHTNIPAGVFPWSMPGSNKWTRTFLPGQFTCTVERAGLNEWWMDPPGGAFPGGDHVCYRYDFTITSGAFNQQGTMIKPAIYWLDVQAQPQGATAGFQFGWKTSTTHWMDAACWVPATESYNGNGWNPLTYPPNHPLAGANIDLAFRLNNLPPKWSQPPDPYTPTNAFNGWNEKSVWNSEQIVADDWVCTNAAPVTDIHWWGSFIGWTSSNLPPIQLQPNGFVISIWNDVPKGAGEPFSRPGVCLTNIYCPALVPTFVGWDYDPRNPGDPPDACFKYDLDLAPDQWFYQAPGTNIYWISIAAQYLVGQLDYPWGWKSRPRDTNSLAPDDAVRIFYPTAPFPGMPYYEGTNIWWPTPSDSWDMAFALTTKQCPLPTLNCLDLNVECGSAWSPPFAWDNCCNVALTPVLLGSVTNGICPWLITETWKATDCIGQTNICNRVITVADTTPPAITCAGNKTVECGASWSFDPPSAPDVCCDTNVTISIVSTVTNGICPWVITRTWMATDCCTNSKTCSQTVTVADTTAPDITCATNKTVLAGAVWYFDPPIAWDVCCGSNVTVTVVSTITNGNCPWYITRTWKATDCCTNSKTCSQMVTVQCPANKWVQGPDLTPNGMDVKASWPKILADDFLCTKTGPITNIHIWASWLYDQPDLMATFQLGLWSDVPRGTAPQGELVANGTFELPFTPAGFSGPLDGVADSIPPSWNRQETFSGGFPENSYIGPIALNGPSAPGLQAAAFLRSGDALQSGDWTAIYQSLSINATQYSTLTLSLDVRVLYHDLEAGGHIAPLPSFEWPAVVQVDYVDTNGVSQIWRYGWYLDPPGDFVTGQVNDPGQGLIPFYNDQRVLQPGMWVPNTFNLLNELPQVQTITRILVGGSGWNFESDVDNVSIRGTSFSHPGELLWMTNLISGQYTYTNEPGQFMQPFYDPNYGVNIGGDSQTWQYDFPVPTNGAFWQTNGHIYWLSVAERSQLGQQVTFGWKTALTNWNDDAVYGHVDSQWIPQRDWQELFASNSIPMRSLDLAFRLTTMWVGAAPVITNIVVTNQVTPTATNQVVGLSWTYDSGVHYQVLSATNLTVVGSNIVWTLCGPDIVAPNHSYWGTNAAGLRRFYRVNAFDP